MLVASRPRLIFKAPVNLLMIKSPKPLQERRKQLSLVNNKGVDPMEIA